MHKKLEEFKSMVRSSTNWGEKQFVVDDLKGYQIEYLLEKGFALERMMGYGKRYRVHVKDFAILTPEQVKEADRQAVIKRMELERTRFERIAHYLSPEILEILGDFSSAALPEENHLETSINWMDLA